MRLLELVLPYLLNLRKQNTTSLLNYVATSNTTSDTKPENENLLNALVIMDFHRSMMNEFLCNKFLLQKGDSNSRNDVFVENDDDGQEFARPESILISDVGSRQYKTWLKRITRSSLPETKKHFPRRYEYRGSPHEHNRRTYVVPANKFVPEDGSFSGGNGKFIAARNQIKPLERPRRYFPARKHHYAKYKSKDYRIPAQSYHQYSRWPYYRKSDVSYGPPSPLKPASNDDKNVAWFLPTESPPPTGNFTTMRLDYNFWDMGSTTPKYGDNSNFMPSPAVYGGEWHHNPEDDDHVLWPGHDCEGKEDEDDDSQGSDDGADGGSGGPLSELLKSDMYHTVLIVFAFVGFTTFLMNIMAGLTNGGGNQVVPSIMFVGNNNDSGEEDQQQRFEPGKRDAYLDNLMKRAAIYIDEFQEILSTMNGDKKLM